MDLKNTTIRPARSGEGQALFDIVKKSVEGLAAADYSPRQIAGWMGTRTASHYEELIGTGSVNVAEQNGYIVGFVDTESGEITRLFLLPEVSGSGLGKRLLELGIHNARKNHHGLIRVESTLNAEGFYRRHGFRSVGKGFFSHGLADEEELAVIYMELDA